MHRLAIHGDDDAAGLSAGFHACMGLDDTDKRVAAVDDGSDGACFAEYRQQGEVFGSAGRRSTGNCPAACHGLERRLEKLGQSGGDQQQSALVVKGLARKRKRRVAHGVENGVPAFATRGEVGGAVVDDRIGAERADHLHLRI
jgi:hypothetical protein